MPSRIDILSRAIEFVRDVALDGRFGFSSARTVVRRTNDHGDMTSEEAIDRVARHHGWLVTVLGFLTGLGGFVTMLIMLPVNVVEFYLHAIRAVGAVASLRGYDLDDDEVRARVLVSLLGEESGDVLDHLGLGTLSGIAAKQVARHLPRSEMSQVTRAIVVRILRRLAHRSITLFGKAIPGLGGVVGAWTDRSQMRKIIAAARRDFPAR